MNTDKVFTAFDKEGKELLLYRKDNDTFINLNSETNDIIPKEDIDLSALYFLSDTIKVLKYMPSSLVKTLYKKDREKLIDTKSVLLGMNVTIENLKTKKIDSGFKWRNIAVRGLWEEWYFDLPVYNFDYQWDLGNKEFGLYMYDGKIEGNNECSFNVYKNMYNFNKYIGFYGNAKGISSAPIFGNGMNYIYLCDKTLYDHMNESLVEKKLVYEFANQVRKNKFDIEGE